MFMDIGLIDIIDILLVAVLSYFFYLILRKTLAFPIIIAIFVIYFFSYFTSILGMVLLSSIFNKIISIGSIVLVVVFQKEIRRFIFELGTKYMQKGLIKKLFSTKTQITTDQFEPIIAACKDMSITKTGAIIVITQKFDLTDFIVTGVFINAKISKDLIKSIFYKNSPLHDGAMIISENQILAARCILPVVESIVIAGKYGLRHRAALGMSEICDAKIIVVSEETGLIAYCYKGEIQFNLTIERLKEELEKAEFNSQMQFFGQK